jgi:hypothetical protein
LFKQLYLRADNLLSRRRLTPLSLRDVSPVKGSTAPTKIQRRVCRGRRPRRPAQQLTTGHWPLTTKSIV